MLLQHNPAYPDNYTHSPVRQENSHQLPFTQARVCGPRHGAAQLRLEYSLSIHYVRRVQGTEDTVTKKG